MNNYTKRFVLFALCIVTVFSLFACDKAPASPSADETSTNEVDETSVKDVESDAVVVIRRMHPFWGVLVDRTITGEVAENISKLLADAVPTGVTVPAIVEGNADDIKEEDYERYGVESGTTWVEANGRIYRFDKGYNLPAIVETYLGKGQELSCDESFARLLSDAWNYWPYDTYKVAVGPDIAPVEEAHIYTAESDVVIKILSVKVVDLTARGFARTGELRFTVTSKTDSIVHCLLKCDQSDHNLGSEESIDLELSAGIPKEATLKFAPYDFVPVLTAGNTKVIIDLKEKD